MNETRRQLILEELDLIFPWARATPTTPKAAETPVAAEIAAPIATATAAASAEHHRPVQTVLAAAADEAAAVGSQRAPLHATIAATNRAAGDAAVSGMDWSALEAAVQGCRACGLCATRSRTVFGVGARNADWMVVGEAPGVEEDRQGEPFVGQAGKLLDAMLASVGRSRQENVFIANVLKCRPPGNRNPQPEEMLRCTPYLERQVALVQPKLIFAVGRFAAQALLGSTAPIASLRGKVHQYQGIPLIVSYHPAYLLRNPADKLKSWEDLLRAKRRLADDT